MNTKILKWLSFIVLTTLMVACSSSESSEKYATKTAEEGGFTYEYVTNDPMNTRIYTLDNGLKVYLSVYKDEPRAQVLIPVKAGGKNDPADNTGLAHYLEHMMFKGSDSFGTVDYTAEKVYLDSIENMFNHYSTLTDPGERKEYYKLIDQVSNKAAEFAIANEYDKMVAEIGGKGANAYTSEDRTVYMNDVPSNQINKYLKLEAERFSKIVNRLFHTELEAVYEEKNADSDLNKVYEALYAETFKEHKYGTQTVIGTIEHLKNPSITAIKDYFDTYYKPNNVAICISGDIDPTETIKAISEYFGEWEPNEDLPKQEKVVEQPITAPRVVEVYGPEAEFLMMGFRFDGQSTNEYRKARMIDFLLANSSAGLIDLNLLQEQKVLTAQSFMNAMNDYSIHTLYGKAKDGQTLEEVKDLMLGEIEKIKKGEFEDWLLDAIVTDFKKSEMSQMESNYSRTNKMVLAFTNDMNWSEMVSEMDFYESLTKQDIVDFANKYYGDNYVAVYKREGEDPNKQQVEKPEITKVPLNRDVQSDWHAEWAQIPAGDIEPVFVDYQKDIDKAQTENGVQVLATLNKENELFDLTYLLSLGTDNDPRMKVAVDYIEYLGTEEFSAEELKKEFYKLGCEYYVYARADRTYVRLTGLDENMEPALELFESLINEPKEDEEALSNYVNRQLRSRADQKKDKGAILWDGLYNYARYGASNSFTNTLSNTALQELDPAELLALVKQIPTLEHRVLYYGPRSASDVADVLEQYHRTPDQLEPLPELVEFAKLPSERKVFWADYEMPQSEVVFVNTNEDYDAGLEPEARLFNEYFGGGMNSIAFQEIREAQGLAYSVSAGYQLASKKDGKNGVFAYIGTQSDKQAEAMKAMVELLNDPPQSQDAFETAKQTMLNKLETERITKSSILWNYETAKRKGLDYDIRKDIYNDVKNMTMDDIMAFHDKYVKDRDYTVVLVGSQENIDFKDLEQYGEVKQVTLEEIFGYGDYQPVNTELNP